MKKMLSLAAMFAALSYASPVFAETNVSVYGILDAAVGDLTHSLSVDPQLPGSVNPVTPVKKTVPGAAIGLFNGGFQSSRVGVKGSSDICEGTKVFFNLEEGINLPTGRVSNSAAALASNGGTATTSYTSGGSVDGQLFSRQANVGLSNADWGSLAVGRNYTLFYDICQAYEPVQAASLFSPIAYSGTYGGGGGATEDLRVDNSLRYTNKIGSFNLGAMYKFGGTAGEASAKSAYGVNAGYNEGNFGIQAAYEAFNDAISASLSTTPNQVAITNENTKAFIVATKYKIGAATLKIGYQQFTLSKPSDTFPTTGSLYNYYGQTVSGLTNFPGADRTTHIVFGGGDYNFSEKFNLAAGIYDLSPQRSDDNVQKSANQIYLSLLADYHITKALDTYAGVMYGSFSGSQYPTTTYYQTNCLSAVGIRYKF
ncbi:MAG: porin [Chlorobiales bacterium]|nr:porin [Chlorobiales bacterium]